MNEPVADLRPGTARAVDQRVRIIVTPEGVPLQFTIARAGARISALVMDLALLLAALVGVTIVFAILPSWQSIGTFLVIMWLLGTFFIRMFYFTFFEMRSRGATPGKRRNGIRVAARNGGRLSPDAVIARNLFRELELFLPLTFLLAMAAEDTATSLLAITGFGWAGIMLFFPLTNRDRLRAGDLLAGTWVIEQPSREIGSRVTGIAAAAQVQSFRASDLDYYGEHELQVLEQVLREDRAEALQAAAEVIGEKIGRLAEAEADHRAFLQSFYEALRQHLESNLQLGVRKASKYEDA